MGAAAASLPSAQDALWTGQAERISRPGTDLQVSETAASPPPVAAAGDLLSGKAHDPAATASVLSAKTPRERSSEQPTDLHPEGQHEQYSAPDLQAMALHPCSGTLAQLPSHEIETSRATQQAGESQQHAGSLQLEEVSAPLQRQQSQPPTQDIGGAAEVETLHPVEASAAEEPAASHASGQGTDMVRTRASAGKGLTPGLWSGVSTLPPQNGLMGSTDEPRGPTGGTDSSAAPADSSQLPAKGKKARGAGPVDELLLALSDAEFIRLAEHHHIMWVKLRGYPHWPVRSSPGCRVPCWGTSMRSKALYDPAMHCLYQPFHPRCRYVSHCGMACYSLCI